MQLSDRHVLVIDCTNFLGRIHSSDRWVRRLATGRTSGASRLDSVWFRHKDTPWTSPVRRTDNVMSLPETPGLEQQTPS